MFIEGLDAVHTAGTLVQKFHVFRNGRESDSRPELNYIDVVPIEKKKKKKLWSCRSLHVSCASSLQGSSVCMYVRQE